MKTFFCRFVRNLHNQAREVHTIITMRLHAIQRWLFLGVLIELTNSLSILTTAGARSVAVRHRASALCMAGADEVRPIVEELLGEHKGKTPVITPYKPGSAWLWSQWQGTVLESTWKRVHTRAV